MSDASSDMIKCDAVFELRRDKHSWNSVALG